MRVFWVIVLGLWAGLWIGSCSHRRAEKFEIYSTEGLLAVYAAVPKGKVLSAKQKKQWLASARQKAQLYCSKRGKSHRDGKDPLGTRRPATWDGEPPVFHYFFECD